jgi:glycosyltransferase involved in cell wall biosynthesis
MSIPEVSVVMAVYNAGPYLAQTVQSVLTQTFGDFEFIIVDDGSTDDSWQILTQAGQQDARIVLLRNSPNQGVVRALNRGLEAARGNFIARQDADDVSLPERFARQLEFFRAHPDHGCVGVAVQMVDPQDRPLGIAYNTTDNESIQRELIDHMCICGPTIVVRKECLAEIGGQFSDGLNASEDYDICLRLAEVTKLAVLPEPLYLYRQHPQSASRTQEHRQAQNKAIALERAVYRRYGPTPGVDQFAMVGKDYLCAAVIGFARHDLEAARKSLNRALEVYPPLLDADQPLEELLRAYTPLSSLALGLQYTASVFDELLPKTRRLMRMKRRLLSYLYMGEVFKGGSKPSRQHLWAGIRYHPAWVLNKGVLSITFKSLFTK